MTMKQTDYAAGRVNAPSPCYAGEMVSYRATYTFVTGELVANQIVEMGPLPAGCEQVDVILDADELDSGVDAIALDVGIMSGDFGEVDDTRTCGDELLDGVDVAQAGGVVRPTLAKAFRIERSDKDRGIGLKIATAPGTAKAGTVGLTVIYRG